jgi:hypothetical protein
MIQWQGFPTWDLEHGMVRAWWFDPLVATLSFAVFINWYWFHERQLGLSTMGRFSDSLRLELGPLWSSGLAYWIGIVIWKCFVPPAAVEDGIPSDTRELLYLFCEIGSGILLYDAIFFGLHWGMHAIPCFRKFHHRHHAATPIEARDVLRHSLLDGGLQVLVNILVQRHTPWGVAKSRLARLGHNVIVVWMLTESHTSSPYPYLWRRWFVGVREHVHHHAAKGDDAKTMNGRFHRYQQFFGYLDDVRIWLGRRECRSAIK